MRAAGEITSEAMKKLVPYLESVIDEDKRVTHGSLVEIVEGYLKDLRLISPELAKKVSTLY